MGEPQQHEPYADEQYAPGVPRQVEGGAKVLRSRQGPTAEAEPVPRARPPHADEDPDVHLDVSRMSVDEIHLHVERLRARVAMQAKVADVLSLDVGADVDLDGVELDIKGVEAEAALKVRLENVEAIIERVLRSIDENPQIVEASARALPSAAEGAAEGAADTASGTVRAPGGNNDSAAAVPLPDLRGGDGRAGTQGREHCLGRRGHRTGGRERLRRGSRRRACGYRGTRGTRGRRGRREHRGDRGLRKDRRTCVSRRTGRAGARGRSGRTRRFR
ncbi:hypothetical protein IDM40_04575 [Nocardiopsis sp. HNM0947]|uniref:Uncharacterized protein n=1 Tax=Nocardiopsis coralli TaxID=2772213 RepID=A0ABR9P2B4_9ACTN|nr:hypothetical protein [Nocardiopsis coralli]MBE2997985.1 hypothetical protein [Nocardiopsis coralli]